MALKDDDDHHTQASEPLLATDVVEVVAPASLREGYGLEVATTNEDGSTAHAEVNVVRERGVQFVDYFNRTLLNLTFYLSYHFYFIVCSLKGEFLKGSVLRRKLDTWIYQTTTGAMVF